MGRILHSTPENSLNNPHMPVIYGYEVRYVSYGDTIMPEDHNNRVLVLLKICDELSRVCSEATW